MGSDGNNWALFSRLKKVVNKVKILLSLSYVTRWRLVSSMIGRSSSSMRCLSFNDRPGLRACADGIDLSDDEFGSSRSGGLHRTKSYPYEDDINKKADLFIANFYRQLQIDRQISLELKYLTEDGSTSISR